MVAVHFLPNYNKQIDTHKFIYTPSILDNEQLFSNIIYRKATQVKEQWVDATILDFSKTFAHYGCYIINWIIMEFEEICTVG